MKPWFLSVAHGAVILGSVGMIGLVKEFPFSSQIEDLKLFPVKAQGIFDGYQVWKYSWGLIIFGTILQLFAVWIWK